MSTEIQERPVFIAASMKLPEPPHRLRAVPPKGTHRRSNHPFMAGGFSFGFTRENKSKININLNKDLTCFSVSKNPGFTPLTLTTVVLDWYSKRDLGMGSIAAFGLFAGTFVPNVKYSCAGHSTTLAARLVNASNI